RSLPHGPSRLSGPALTLAQLAPAAAPPPAAPLGARLEGRGDVPAQGGRLHPPGPLPPRRQGRQRPDPGGAVLRQKARRAALAVGGDRGAEAGGGHPRGEVAPRGPRQRLAAPPAGCTPSCRTCTFWAGRSRSPSPCRAASRAPWWTYRSGITAGRRPTGW